MATAARLPHRRREPAVGQGSCRDGESHRQPTREAAAGCGQRRAAADESACRAPLLKTRWSIKALNAVTVVRRGVEDPPRKAIRHCTAT